MKCQALLSLGFFVKAASVAAQVISLAPSWAEGQLTFARVQRELGEVEIGILTSIESLCYIFIVILFVDAFLQQLWATKRHYD